MMSQIRLPEIPYELQWENQPLFWKVGLEDGFIIQAGEYTDLFVDPAVNSPIENAPRAIFTPANTSFILSAKLNVEFLSAFDAGGLLIELRSDLWAKLCFEYSLQLRPTIVSVVTRGVSDDSIANEIDSHEIYLRLAYTPKITAFHYSLDGNYWHLVRYFTLGEQGSVKIGFLSQSPTGKSCWVRFSEIHYFIQILKDYRNGE